MSRLTLDVPAELKALLGRYPSIRWDEVAAEALWSYARKVQLADQIAGRSRLTAGAAAEIGREVKAGLRRRYAKAAR